MAQFLPSASNGFIVWNMEYEIDLDRDPVPSRLYVAHISYRSTE